MASNKIDKAGKNTLTLSQRLERLENEKRVRECMTRYMSLCDELNEDFDLEPLMSLFTEDASWQGAGKRYAKTYGVYEGRQAIADMFVTYIQGSPHFELNAHFLCNELINVADDTAVGSWMLIQPSTFSSGKSQLSCARIHAEFCCDDGNWKIATFTTTNIFSRPMAEAWDNTVPLAVPDRNIRKK